MKRFFKKKLLALLSIFACVCLICGIVGCNQTLGGTNSDPTQSSDVGETQLPSNDANGEEEYPDDDGKGDELLPVVTPEVTIVEESITVQLWQERVGIAVSANVDGTLVWESSNTDVLTIEEGLLFLHDKGQATVTVALEENLSVKDCIEVTVEDSEETLRADVKVGGAFDTNVNATFYAQEHRAVSGALNGTTSPAPYTASAKSKPVTLALNEGKVSVTTEESTYTKWAYLFVKLTGQSLEANQEYVFTLGTSSAIENSVSNNYQVGILADDAEKGVPACIRSIKIYDVAATTVAGANGLKTMNLEKDFFNGNGTVRFTPLQAYAGSVYVMFRAANDQAFDFDITSLRFGKAETKVVTPTAKFGEKDMTVTYYSLQDADVAGTKDVNSNAYSSKTTRLVDRGNGKIVVTSENVTATYPNLGYIMMKFDLGTNQVESGRSYNLNFHFHWLSTKTSTAANAFIGIVVNENKTTEKAWKLNGAIDGNGMKQLSLAKLSGQDSNPVPILVTPAADASVFYVIIRSQAMGAFHFEIDGISLQIAS